MKYLFLFVLITACSSSATQLTDEAKGIEVMTNKPSGCNVVGKVMGVDDVGSKELALNRALNSAAKLGATALHVNQEVPNGKKMVVYGTAYKCD